MVSKNLDIKDLSRSIEMKDQTASNEDNNKNEDNVAHKDENTFQTFNGEDGASVEPQIYISTTGINAANRKVKREDGIKKYDCNQCDKQYSDPRPLSRHIKSKHEGVKYA